MNRREFVSWVGMGALATSLPVAIAACQSDTASTEDTAPEETTAPAEPESDTEQAAAPDAEGFVPIGPVSELDESGSISDKSFQGEQVLVVRDPADESALIAVNSLCTHQGCSVAWEDGMFACPCHGSTFNPDGTVAGGPASNPLGTFEAKVEEDQVLVRVS